MSSSSDAQQKGAAEGGDATNSSSSPTSTISVSKDSLTTLGIPPFHGTPSSKSSSAGISPQRPNLVRAMTASAPVPPPMASRSVSERSIAGINSQLESLLRGAALMYEEPTSSDETSDSDEDEDVDDVEDEANSAPPARSTSEPPLNGDAATPKSAAAAAVNEAPPPGMDADTVEEWARLKETAARADTKDRRMRKALLKKIATLKDRKYINTHHAPLNARNLLDEDETLAAHLDASAIDSLDEEGAEQRSSLRGLAGQDADDEDEDGEVDEGNGSKDLGAGGEDADYNPQTKLAALVSEFGKCNHAEEEVWVASVPAVLSRRVLIKGSILLTNHRMCFIAYLPSHETLSSPETLPSTGASKPIKRGPATLHRPGLHRKKRMWLELRPDALTGYPSSTAQFTPLGSLRMSDIDEVLPHRWGHPTCVDFKTKGRRHFLEFDTEESALEWHREIESAHWKFQTSADKVRIAIPLPRLLSVSRTAYMHFATSIWLTVLEESGEKTDENSLPKIELAFGILRNHEHFLDTLSTEFQKAVAQRDKNGIESVLKNTPAALLEIEGPRSRDDELAQAANETDGGGLAAKLIKSFSLSCKADDVKLVKADMVRTLPLAGTLALTPDDMVFWRQRLGSLQDTRVQVPLNTIVSADSAKTFRWHTHGLRLQIRGHPDMLFEMRSSKARDFTRDAIRESIEKREKAASDSASAATRRSDEARESHEMSRAATILLEDKGAFTTPLMDKQSLKYLPKVVNLAPENQGRRLGRMKIALMTIGSRGDVQPYISLALALKKHGHHVFICSHPEYKDWVNKYGIEYRPMGGDPGALMKLSVEHRLFSPAFFRESLGKFRAWLDELLREAYEQAYDADLIIESPSTMAGIHVAEAVDAYYMRAFTMPWTRCREYPQAFSVPSTDLGGQYNLLSYTLFDNVFWKASAGQINRWRKHMLHLGPTDLAHLQHVPFMYNFSPAVVPPVLDWGDEIAITGYWMLDSTAEKWTPPEDLKEFMDKARKEDKKIAYIGFGSITVPDAAATTQAIYDAVVKADVRAIVSKGWSDRMSGADADKKKTTPPTVPPLSVPEQCYVVDSIPHDWLFPKIDIALHHGGAGTTGASLNAGLVTLIHPFFGDQFFWAGRVQKLGAGARVNGLTAKDMSEALIAAAGDRIMVEKAQAVGEQIRSENGPEEAIKFIYTNLSRSKRKKVPLRPSSKAPKALTSPLQALNITSGETPSASEAEGEESHTDGEVSEAATPVTPASTVPSTFSACVASVGDSIKRVASPLGLVSSAKTPVEPVEPPQADHALKASNTVSPLVTPSETTVPSPVASPTLASVGLPEVRTSGHAKRSSTLGFHLPSLGLSKRAETSTTLASVATTDSTATVDSSAASSKPISREDTANPDPLSGEVRRTHKTAKAEDKRRRALLEAKWARQCPDGEDGEHDDLVTSPVDETGPSHCRSEDPSAEWGLEHQERTAQRKKTYLSSREGSTVSRQSTAISRDPSSIGLPTPISREPSSTSVETPKP